MEIEIKSKNANDSIRGAKICEEIFDSVTIYIHITTNSGVNPASRLSFSNIPFTDPKWKDNLHHICVNEKENDTGVSYNTHRQLMLDLAYILSIRGHEVFICVSQDPSEKNGHYTNVSKKIKTALISIKESADETVVEENPC